MQHFRGPPLLPRKGRRPAVELRRLRVGAIASANPKEGAMLTRRSFQSGIIALCIAGSDRRASAQQSDMVTVRIRADASVRAVIPPIVQGSLTIEPDQSAEAKDLARRSPPDRAVPILFIIVGAIAVTELLGMIKELVREVYYGGVLIDMRAQPPNVTSDSKIPANMIFVIDPDGKTTRYTSDQFNLDALKLALKSK
jgi:hypothetical protein